MESYNKVLVASGSLSLVVGRKRNSLWKFCDEARFEFVCSEHNFLYL